MLRYYSIDPYYIEILEKKSLSSLFYLNKDRNKFLGKKFAPFILTFFYK